MVKAAIGLETAKAAARKHIEETRMENAAKERAAEELAREEKTELETQRARYNGLTRKEAHVALMARAEQIVGDGHEMPIAKHVEVHHAEIEAQEKEQHSELVKSVKEQVEGGQLAEEDSAPLLALLPKIASIQTQVQKAHATFLKLRGEKERTGNPACAHLAREVQAHGKRLVDEQDEVRKKYPWLFADTRR